MKKLIALRHISFEDLGIFHDIFIKNGFDISYIDLGLNDLDEIEPLSPDLVVILGGPIGAYEEDKYPFLEQELSFILQRLNAKRPILGFCLGAQLIARALGSHIYPGPTTEIGWIPLQLTTIGKQSPVRHLDGKLTSMLHWHSDTFDLPKDAEQLASTHSCANQIFSWGHNCLAFQCHPEVDATRIESWLIGHTCELDKHNKNIPQLRADSLKFGQILRQQATLCIEEWIGQVQW